MVYYILQNIWGNDMIMENRQREICYAEIYALHGFIHLSYYWTTNS